MKTIHQPVTRLDYCQYLLVSQINYTLTNFADHTEQFSHDAANRYLAGDQIRPRLVWENVQAQVIQTSEGYVVFDNTVVDKDFASEIELVRRQYSGNAHGLIKGVGVVTCVYINPTLDEFWIIDYRIYAPESDGKSKLDHVHDMLTNCVYQSSATGCPGLVRLKQVAWETKQTIYKVKHGLLSDYLRQQLKSPTVTMLLA